jgi:putative addiction module component (TIGR02574 family)
MSALYDQLEMQARQLSVEERAKLAHTLIEELDSEVEANLEDLWNAEAQRRYEAYLKGEIGSRRGDEVMNNARSRLK